ncbi:MAG: nucleoside deaminase, partial [Candidatus Marinimicrobia bacterium]|nr:nucleoside deaminase [Candidatus Neomarinimicrobiota bacterium]
MKYFLKLRMNFKNDQDEYWMDVAIKEAEKAFDEGEMPVGAIIVRNNIIVGKGYNQRERLKDPTAHAEILAITSAAGTINSWRLA